MTEVVADAADYRALRHDAGAVRLRRDVVAVTGPDAVSFLQGQLSQDVVAVPVGSSAWSLVLQPQGKVDALVRLTRTGAEEVVLDVDGGWGEALEARLRRFLLRVQVEIEERPWSCVAVRGPRAHELAAAADATVRAPADWPGLAGVDLLGPDVQVPDGVRECEAAAYEVVRIEAGVPVMGAELDAGTIPAAAGIVERTVSFTKGCFTGQELVARIDSRGGNVPRRLLGLVVDGVVPPVPATVHAGDRVVGDVTSAAGHPEHGGAVALAYVARGVEPPADVEVRWDGTTASGRVLDLPLA